MHGMSCAICYNFAENPVSKKREIADEIEDLVPHKFVTKTQRTVFHPAIG